VITRQELYDRGCVASLIHVVEQLPLRASVRGPLTIDESTTGLLLLWSALRWERTFAIRTLEDLHVDLWLLTREVDEALRACGAHGGENPPINSPARIDICSRSWLDLAAEEAKSLQHDYIGIEHLLLALVVRDTQPLAAIFERSGVKYSSLKQAVVSGLAQAAVPLLTLVEAPAPSSPHPTAVAAQAFSAPTKAAQAATASWITEVDRPAVGVPRRFGMFIMMMMMTLYALLFSLMKVMNASTAIFAFIALLFTGIGIGQAVLFGGRYPRAASIWTGMVLVPIETLGFCIFQNDFHFGNLSVVQIFGATLAIIFVGIPLGAVLGYLFGTVTAGGFYLEDWYDKRRRQRE
jgi:hypothetical protein